MTAASTQSIPIMKASILITSILAAVGSAPASAAILYFDLGSVVIPNGEPDGITGVYVNIVTGATATSEPVDFNSAPWINLFLGGTGIANGELLRPWASSASYDPDTNYFVNLAPGTTIDSSGLFVGGESASIFHLGGAGDQFQSGVQGFLAFAYKATASSDLAYGWLSFTPNEFGDGAALDLAYSDTPGESITVGAVPEPAAYAALAGSFGLLAAVAVRRRRTR